MYEDLNIKLKKLAKNFKKGFQLGKKVKQTTRDNFDLFNFLTKEENLSIKFIVKDIEKKTGLQLNAQTISTYFYKQKNNVEQNKNRGTINTNDKTNEVKKCLTPIDERSDEKSTKNQNKNIETNENGEHMFFEKLVERGMLKSFKDESKKNNK